MRPFLCLPFLATVACAATVAPAPVYAQQVREYTTQGATFRVYDVKLRSCYDGDTCYFDIYLGLGQVAVDQVVRLCDIDTPEIRPLATREQAEQVRKILVDWISAASEVELHVLQKKDCRITDNKVCDDDGKFGRYLVYVFADGRNLNMELLNQGYAKILTDQNGKAILCKGK